MISVIEPAPSVEVGELIEDADFLVRPEYLDPNEHMNVGYYSVLFDLALARLRARLGLDEAALSAQGLEWFERDVHVLYRRELMPGDHLYCRFLLLDMDDGSLHCFMSMYHAGEGWLAATSERAVQCRRAGNSEQADWPVHGRRELRRLCSAHAGLPQPVGVGSAIQVRNPHPPGLLTADAAGVPADLPADVTAHIRAMDFSKLWVRPEYTGADGHIRPGYLTVLIDLAMRRITSEAVGMGFAHMERTGMTGFVAETHLTQFRKLSRGDPLRYEFKVVNIGDKVLQCLTSLYHGREGWLAAAQEQMSMSIDLGTRRPAAFHPTVRARLELTVAQQRELPNNMALGRAVNLRG